VIDLPTTRVVSHIVASIHIPVDVVINREEGDASAKNIVIKLPTQTRLVNLIIVLEGVDRVRELNSRLNGRT